MIGTTIFIYHKEFRDSTDCNAMNDILLQSCEERRLFGRRAMSFVRKAEVVAYYFFRGGITSKIG